MAKRKENTLEKKAKTATIAPGAANEETSDEKLAFAKIQFRKNWKEAKLDKYADVPEEDGDDEYIESCKNDLNAAIDEVQSMKFTIYTKEDGDKRIEAAKLIKDANYVGTFWENGEWRGVLSLDKVMTETIEKLEKDAEADFEIDWSTLMFVHQLMKSPKGYGVESARRLAAWEQYDEQKQELKPEAENAVTYSGILRKVNEHVRRLSFYDKKMNILRNRLDFAYAGVRMNLKVNDLEEFVAFNDALVGASLPQDDKELQKTLSE